VKVTLFLTYGNSLGTWDRAGILERELAIYKEQARRYQIDLTIFSYGKKSEREYQERFPEIKICFNHLSLPTMIYGKLAPLLFPRMLQEANVIKTNQMLGAHVAASCSRKYGKPLYVRQGYSFWESESEKWGKHSSRARFALKYEKAVSGEAHHLAFSTKRMAEEFIRRHTVVVKDKVSVLPNYVVEKTWSPPFKVPSRSTRLRIGFVGKFTEQKNLKNLVEACSDLDVELALIGSGKLENALRDQTKRRAVPATFHGRLIQEEVREVLRKCDCFILPSNYEGQPKALLEAMMFGMPIIGANISGIKELIMDGENGILTETSPRGLRVAISRMLLASTEERQRWGNKVRTVAVEDSSFNRVVDKDFEILTKLAKCNADSG